MNEPMKPSQRMALAEQKIATLEKQVAELLAFKNAMIGAITGGSSVGGVATDRELDDPKFGNPKVRFDPRDWKGPKRKGWLMSRCEPEFLDAYVDALEFFAQRNDDEGKKDDKGNPKSKWDRLDARRARGWAKRLRDGWKPSGATTSTNGSTGNGYGLPPGAEPSARHREQELEPDIFDDDRIPTDTADDDDEIPF